MKTTILLLSAAFSSLVLVGCETSAPPDDFTDAPPPPRVERREPEPTPRSDAPEDFRAVTPPSSYSR